MEEGITKAGDERLDYRIYLLGRTPKAWNKQRIAWTWDHGHLLDAAYRPSHEWYVAGYYLKQYACDRWPHLTDEHLAECHPFGEHFLLMEHAIHTYGYYKDFAIDHFEILEGKRPMARRPMNVEYLTPA